MIQISDKKIRLQNPVLYLNDQKLIDCLEYTIDHDLGMTKDAC